MNRSLSQAIMDEARGDPLGYQRAKAWETYNALQAETNARGWFPPGPSDPRSFVMGERVVIPSFPISDIKPWVGSRSPSFHEPSFVAVPADPGPNTKRKG